MRVKELVSAMNDCKFQVEKYNAEKYWIVITLNKNSKNNLTT